MRKTDNPDQKQRYFRSSARLFQMNGDWYFATREGEMGPFPSQRSAQLEMVRYVADREALDGFQQARDQRIDKLAPRKAATRWRGSKRKPDQRDEIVLTPTLELI